MLSHGDDSVGIGQWLNGNAKRRDNLFRYAGDSHVKSRAAWYGAAKENIQLMFTWDELTQLTNDLVTGHNALPNIRSVKGNTIKAVNKATGMFEQNFEGAGQIELGSRQSDARTVFRMFG